MKVSVQYEASDIICKNKNEIFKKDIYKACKFWKYEIVFDETTQGKMFFL